MIVARAADIAAVGWRPEPAQAGAPVGAQQGAQEDLQENAGADTAEALAEPAFELGLRIRDDLYLTDPLWLGLLPVLALAALLGRSGSRRSLGLVGALPASLQGGREPRSLRQRLSPLVGLLQALGLLAMVFALARPVVANVLRADVSEGVDILLCVDRSGSMEETDMARRMTRLDVVKRVAAEFAERRTNDTVGAADAIGVLAFAAYPTLLLPFTLDADMIAASLSSIRPLNPYDPANGTGVGVALAKAVQVLSQSEAKSRVAVLLTDGENNVPNITPMEAAAFAEREGVRVHTILAGRGAARGGRAMAARESLSGIAEQTGGRFFAAEDALELEAVYAEIEQLERTPRERRRFASTRDLYPRLLALGLLAYGAAWLCTGTWSGRAIG